MKSKEKKKNEDPPKYLQRYLRLNMLWTGVLLFLTISLRITAFNLQLALIIADVILIMICTLGLRHRKRWAYYGSLIGYGLFAIIHGSDLLFFNLLLLSITAILMIVMIHPNRKYFD